jgi:hypothetical protein
MAQEARMQKEAVLRMTHLSEADIMTKLEEERLIRLHKAASNLKSNLIAEGRCPMCTLTLPCKHFKDKMEMFSQRAKFFKKVEWGLLSDNNRKNMIKLKL